MRNYLTLGPVRLLVNRKYLASWGFPRLSIGGVSLWSKSNNGDRILASRHPRDSLTWHWSVSITKRNPSMWSAEAREGRAQLYREGNPYVTAPSWRDRFMSLTNNPRGQWHNYFRLPFGWALCIARQDYHKPRVVEATLDTSAPVRTRDGRAARILETGRNAMEGPYPFPIRAEVENGDAWVRWNYMANGQFKSNEPGHALDLVNHRPH